MSESQAEKLERLLEQSRNLDRDLEQCLGQSRSLEQQQRFLGNSLAQMESDPKGARVAGLQPGRVDAGGRDGEPAAQRRTGPGAGEGGLGRPPANPDGKDGRALEPPGRRSELHTEKRRRGVSGL